MRNFLISGLLFTCIIICGCQINPQIQTEEDITVMLPAWPPEDSFSADYPPLSRWVITLTAADFHNSFSTSEKTVQIHIKKNCPLSVLIYPITLLENGEECKFFKPAGFLYPWSFENTNCATSSWEQGFLADIMRCFFLNGKENYVPSGEMAWLASTFNWKKAQETIEKKIIESQNITGSEASTEDEKKFYNPWLIPTAPILENISVSQFKASLLNLTGCYAISISISPWLGAQSCSIGAQSCSTQQTPPPFSSFIPENRSLPQKKQFTVRKGCPFLVSSAKKYGIVITCQSAKKISLERIYMPIFIEEI